MSRRVLLVFVALLVGAFASGAGASVTVPHTLESLTRQAERVVRVRVVDTRTVATDGGRRLFTLARVEVREVLKGPEAADLEVVFPGGVSEEVAQRVSGVPLPAEGDELVLFLTRRPGPADGPAMFELVGLGHGVLEVRDQEVRPRVEGLEVKTGPLDAPAPAPADALPLDALRARVRAVLEETAR